MSGAGGGKRPSGGDSPPGPPEKKSKKEEKTTTTLIEPIRIAGVSSTEEMDMKVLQFKNKKLCERLEQRQAMEDELREKIEKLEKRQATDDTTLLIVNRYWSQVRAGLEDNVKVLRKCIEPELASGPAPPSAPPPETMATEDNGVALTLPTSASEAGLTDQQLQPEERQEDHQDELQQPAPPAGGDELTPPTEPPSDPKTEMNLDLCLVFLTHVLFLQLKSGYSSTGSSGGLAGGQITLNIQKFESLNAELEHNQELANSRMAELEKLQLELQEAVRESEKLKMDLRNIPEEVVKETSEYKCLQSQFSLLYNESLGVKTQLDEARALLLTTKNAHLRQIEHMEVSPPKHTP
uniref:E3 ubiquitin protein ligase n=1 Tax=Poecilia latipinna TaxID=48699 RepID=A0A3B3TLJ6_9TELE